ncbi:MAG TPA: hypothetical protein VKR99_08415, partial [Candidatus Eremiobacteraceae bacterium]|nr:hypothetical protein [Candidatus Eremiobacteraceae bacterium]
MAGSTLLETRTQTFDVVIDLQTARLDDVFTYAWIGPQAPIGSRVRVPFGNRTVTGWIVGRGDLGKARRGSEPRTVKYIEEVLDDKALDPASIALAAWLRRHYACTFREALLTVAPRGEPQLAERFAFAAEPAVVDEQAQVLHRRFGSKTFTPLSARRSLSTRTKKVPLSVVRRALLRLVQEGVVRRVVAPATTKDRLNKDSLLVLGDAAAARTPAQKRLAAALADAGGSLFYHEAQARASANAALVRRACASGIVRIEHHAPRSPRVPSTAPASAFTPTAEQRAAIDRIDAAMRAGGVIALLHGVTGSGKTFVYSRLVDRVRSNGGQAIVL